jgi:Fe-S-cluster-containing dehydrogenase component/anaerobic selenocysteine-containing dehydrogenase
MEEAAGAEGSSGCGVDRRRALRLLAAGMALTSSACGRPEEEIAPYVEMPEGLTPGVPLFFATALPLSGFGRGALVTTYEGRPTKIDGNPRHPASLGAADIFLQSEIISLYHPDRAKAVSDENGLSTWKAFSTALFRQMQKEQARNGSGLRFLTGRVTSPTFARQMGDLLKAFPEARWLRYEPIHDDAVSSGAALAFGRPLTALPRLEDASVILTLGADPLGPGPAQLHLASSFNKARLSRLQSGKTVRLYVIEPCWTLTGANADEWLAASPGLIRNIAIEIAKSLGAGASGGDVPEPARRFVDAAVKDLQANIGRAIVLAGREQPPELHALCHWINDRLKAPVDYIAPVDPIAAGHIQSLRDVESDLRQNRAETLIIVDCNPAYSAPGELRLGEAIEAAAFTAHLGMFEDETASACKWRLPLSHMFESWSDLRAFEGTASIVQPMIRPLYDTRSAHQLLALIGSGAESASSYDLVRDSWRNHVGSSDFETAWRSWLHEGTIPATAQNRVTPPRVKLVDIRPAAASQGLVLALGPDPSIWDGSYCNNPWLQECPKPLTKQVWGNALQVSPQDAAAHNLQDGDIVSVSRGERVVEAPVHVVEGQAAGVLGATLGYGRQRAGDIGTDIGFDVFRLQTANSPWFIDDVRLAATGKRQPILTTQHNFKIEADVKDILPTLTFADLAEGRVELPQSVDLPTLLPDWRYDSYKWAMTIDNAACIGCNACVVACQSENNVPVVGPEEIAMGRDMHWLRVDAYFSTRAGQPLGFEPVPCMQCEYAPCEPVCPVAASVHDSEGLNVQVYNRCVGTRFCQSNCPYKVRRFNFFGYADGESYANLGEAPLEAHFNPDVTVRARGVMEKCTYCVQRISRARREAEKENRRIPPGGVITACQAACPTHAINFGDLNDPASPIHPLRKEPRHYVLLGHLGTRPRTTYLAAVKNPNPTLAPEKT